MHHLLAAARGGSALRRRLTGGWCGTQPPTARLAAAWISGSGRQDLCAATKTTSTSAGSAAAAAQALDEARCRQPGVPASLRHTSQLVRRGFSSSSSSSSRSSSSSGDEAAGGSSTSSTAAEREPETPLLQSIRNRIMIRGGPLSVAEYMGEVATHPGRGYYMSRDVFGSAGDFITSPEISQMFGEMVGIWCVVLWQQLGCPASLALVELGPGRGTLMADLLRGTAGFKGFADALQVHLVEVSPFLRQQQWDTLRCRATGDSSSSSSSSLPETGVSALNGAQVTWHASLDAVPSVSPSLFLAHEFLDALPVHQFVRDPSGRRGWLEVMVDTAEHEHSADESAEAGSSRSSSRQLSPEGIPLVSAPQQHTGGSSSSCTSTQPVAAAEAAGAGGSAADTSGLHLRFVLSPSPTPASQLLVKRRLEALSQEQQQAHAHAIEVGAQAMAAVESLARRIASSGGAALLIDYGANKPFTDSLTAIRGHAGVHPLSQPGSADLSAWVDFSAMRLAAEQAFDVQPGAGASGASLPGAEEGGSQDGSSPGSSAAAGVEVHGPVTQAHLLHSLGIQARLQSLAEGASPAQAQALLDGYKRLVETGPGGMGGAYLAMAITQRDLPGPPPVGFEAGGESAGDARGAKT